MPSILAETKYNSTIILFINPWSCEVAKLITKEVLLNKYANILQVHQVTILKETINRSKSNLEALIKDLVTCDITKATK